MAPFMLKKQPDIVTTVRFGRVMGEDDDRWGVKRKNRDENLYCTKKKSYHSCKEGEGGFIHCFILFLINLIVFRRLRKYIGPQSFSKWPDAEAR